MALISKAKFEAQKLLKEIGVEDITDIPMDYLAAGIGATLIEEPLKYCDGRISFSKNHSLIKIKVSVGMNQPNEMLMTKWHKFIENSQKFFEKLKCKGGR